ncbi:hypothetical protein AVEN_57986-1, partial [Araneus ventricosus]
MEEVKEAKYYDVMFDCTPGVSHIEQMSQVLRYVRVVGNVPEITERFIDFFTKTFKKIDIVSKMLHKEKIAIDLACNFLQGLTAQIKDWRGTTVNEVLEEAKQSCLALNVDPSFKEVRKRKKKSFFDEKCEDDSSEISRHKKLKFASLQVNDRIEAQLERRFQSMQKV